MQSDTKYNDKPPPPSHLLNDALNDRERGAAADPLVYWIGPDRQEGIELVDLDRVKVRVPLKNLALKKLLGFRPVLVPEQLFQRFRV